MISSGLYRPARRETINYPLTGAMSRENWCFGRRPVKCGNLVTLVADQIASTSEASNRYLAELKTLARLRGFGVFEGTASSRSMG
jgi:hypothetical protein